MQEVFREAILDALWPKQLASGSKVMAVLDGAQDDVIYAMVRDAFQEKYCLYGGNLPWPLPQTAPYLVELERGDRLTRFLIEKGWGRNWGFYLRSASSTKAVRHHLRRLLIVRDDKGRRRIFRFYDPRVLRVYLPSCTREELRIFAGPATDFLMESADGKGVQAFSFSPNGRLISTLDGVTQP
jgi:hypothetical protein